MRNLRLLGENLIGQYHPLILICAECKAAPLLIQFLIIKGYGVAKSADLRHLVHISFRVGVLGDIGLYTCLCIDSVLLCLRIKCRNSLKFLWIFNRLSHRHIVKLKNIYPHTVGRTVAVRGKDRIIAVLGIDEKKIVSRRRIRESHIQRNGPVFLILIPFRHIQIVPSRTIKSFRRKIHFLAIRRKHRIYLI